MNAKHTPGPWIADKVDGGYLIASNSQNLPHHAEAMEEGDANLIAAAPELLEALRQIVYKASHNFKMTSYEGPAYITREDISVKMAIAAIAKAEGRE